MGENAVASARDFIWVPPLIVLLCGVGLYLTVFGGFLQFRRLPLILRLTLCSLFIRNKKRRKGAVSPFRAMSAALAGTLGIGNIIGVAGAVMLGGPGAVFWMWVSGFIGMMTKFSEVALAVRFREKASGGGYAGGPMHYIVNGLGERFRPLAALFSLMCILASFGIGNMTQISSIAGAAEKSFGTPALFTGILAAVLVGLTIFGGFSRISAITSVIVPVMSVFYILGSLTVIAVNYANILPAFGDIFKGAFTPSAAAGGAAGFTAAQAIRFGVSRGVFTHEAGMGSAPIAHAGADTESPVEQGFWGAFEVFADTLVICTLSALVILTTGVMNTRPAQGSLAVSQAFGSVFANYGEYFITVAVIFFAFSTILGWAYYAERCCSFLFKKHEKRAVSVFRGIFVLAVAAGSLIKAGTVWNLADIFNGLMAFPNLIALILLSPVVFNMLKRYFARR